MTNNDFVLKKLQYYLVNFENLTEEEIKQSQYLVLYKANEQMNKYFELINEVREQNKILIIQNQQLKKITEHYKNFIKDSNLTKRFELYSKGKEAI